MSILERLSLKGRTAMVTGGAGGIGQVVCAQLRDLGAIVVIADGSDQAKAAAESLGGPKRNVDWVKLDVTDSKSVDDAFREAFKRYKKIDILVAAAGIAYEEPSISHSDEMWKKVMAINLDGVFYSMRAAAQHMSNSGGGSIVAISSIAGVTAVRPEVHIGYDVSKAAVAHMCRNLAIEWAPENIRVNAVGPAHTDTQMLAEVGRSKPEILKLWLSDIPMHRLVQPHEVADAIAYLVSDAASAVTGHVLMVDGGYSVA